MKNYRNMKKIITLLVICFIVSLFGTMSFAKEITCDGITTTVNDNMEYEVSFLDSSQNANGYINVEKTIVFEVTVPGVNLDLKSPYFRTYSGYANFSSYVYTQFDWIIWETFEYCKYNMLKTPFSYVGSDNIDLYSSYICDDQFFTTALNVKSSGTGSIQIPLKFELTLKGTSADVSVAPLPKIVIPKTNLCLAVGNIPLAEDIEIDLSRLGNFNITDPSHNHNYSLWHNDSNQHWHECTGDTGICERPKKDISNHTYGSTGIDRYTCTTCNFVDLNRKQEAEKIDEELAATKPSIDIPPTLSGPSHNNVIITPSVPQKDAKIDTYKETQKDTNIVDIDKQTVKVAKKTSSKVAKKTSSKVAKKTPSKVAKKSPSLKKVHDEDITKLSFGKVLLYAIVIVVVASLVAILLIRKKFLR